MYIETQSGEKPAHIIVCGNEKGGSGKTTTAMHIIVYLLNAGYRVASIDLDSRQLSLSRYLENRRKWQTKSDFQLVHPQHFHLDAAEFETTVECENEDLEKFSDILADIDGQFDFVVIDTPGHNGYLMRLAHSMADTLVTPLNDSFIDFDVLGQVDQENGEVTSITHYASMVRSARRHRRQVDNGILDWIVVRNRLSNINSRNKSKMQGSLRNLSLHLGCRLATGITERVIFREFFPIGLTALDDLSEYSPGKGPSASHLSARKEVHNLIDTLRLPVNDISRQRAEARKVWFENSKKPLETADIFFDLHV